MKEEILARNPNFENEFRELVSLDGMRYFYHVTNQNGDEICNDGLYLVDKRLDSTTIEIPQEFIDDPINYCLQENGENYRKNPNIVLLGIPEEDGFPGKSGCIFILTWKHFHSLGRGVPADGRPWKKIQI